MVLTLWFSSKAKKVVKTSLDLSDQNDIKERFRPNFYPDYWFGFCWLKPIFFNLFPAGISNKISGSFEMTVDMSALKIPMHPHSIPLGLLSTLQ